MKLIAFAVLTLLGVPAGFAQEPAGVPTAEAAPAPPDTAWTRIAGSDSTGCALGGPYAFFVHHGDPTRLLVDFQGGGACSSGATCDVRLKRPFFKPVVGAKESPSRERGLFDLSNAENPVRDFTIVYVPYCTGDVHIGERDTTYAIPAHDSLPADRVHVRHNGYRNAMAALRWVYANVPAPRVLVVAGQSAGAIPTPFYADLMAGHYPRARVVGIADAAGGYRSPGIRTAMRAWNSAEVLAADSMLARTDTAKLDFETLYVAAGRRPNVTLAEINTIEDETQRLFLKVVEGKDVSLAPRLAANLAEIRAAVPHFRSYTAPGEEHTILERPEFYTLSVNGVRVRDWVADLIAGKTVGDVACDGCLPAAAAGP